MDMASEWAEMTADETAELKHRVFQMNPGDVAKRLRLERGLTVEAVAEELDVEVRVVHQFEAMGLTRWLEESFSVVWERWNRGDELDEAALEKRRDTQLDRYFAMLQPSPAEEVILRHDRQADVTAVMERLAQATGMTREEFYRPPAPPSDPWDTEPKAKKPRTRGVKQWTTQPAVGALVPAAGAEAASAQGSSVRFKLQLIAVTDEGEETLELGHLTKGADRLDQVGLTLGESKILLRALQEQIVAKQLAVALAHHGACPKCQRRLSRKGERNIKLRTVFGTVVAPSPRLRRCAPCGDKGTFSPLAELLPERTTPELLFLESKWSSLVSYELTSRMLSEFLPVDDKINANTIRNHVMRVAERCEQELEDEPASFATNASPALFLQTASSGTLTVGIDGGYLKQWRSRSKNFEVIVGKSVPADSGDAKCFGLVQQFDSKPRRRMYEMMRAQGMDAERPVRFLSDGETSVRKLQKYLSPNAEHVLDWFHIAMRWTRIRQLVRGVVAIEKAEGAYSERSPAFSMQCELDKAKWKLWHGKASEAIDLFEDIGVLGWNFEDSYARHEQLQAAVAEMVTYLRRNRLFLTNYGADSRAGLAISTAFVESMVNALLARRFVKKQQMQWTHRGAHNLLQIRVRVANRELRDTFRRWYPGFDARHLELPDDEASMAIAA